MMRYGLRWLVLFALSASVITASSQKWRDAYERGLRLAQQGNWADAKKAFEEAIADRPEDSQEASTVGAAVTARRPWRNGAPYSPNFAVAYCSFKLAAAAQTKEERDAHLKDAIAGFTKLINEGKASVEAMMLLASSYAAAGNMEEASKIQKALSQMDLANAYKVDRDVLDATDLGLMSGAASPGTHTSGGEPVSLPGRFGLVPVLDFKYALLIGTSENGGPEFALNDVDLLRDALIEHAGYAESNIVVLKNPTLEEMRKQAEALAERMPEAGTLFFFFSGPGMYDEKAKKDYLIAADSDRTKAETMLPKVEMYRIFMQKGAAIFAFFETSRLENAGGGFFGKEVPELGRIAQCHGTMPGADVFGLIADGKRYGVYARAIAETLSEFHTNQVEVGEFCWQVFDRVRKGAGASVGGLQVPTLPVVVGMTPTSRF